VQAPKYRVQAAKKLIGNHKAVTRFALRGAPGAKAGKRFTAPLADPNVSPALDFEAPLAAALQCTATALLQGTDQAGKEFGGLDWLEGERSREETLRAVQASLEYLRDRVGVPRDMQLPAALQLRAHLNWTIDLIQDQKP
jgi:glutathione S-transferase